MRNALLILGAGPTGLAVAKAFREAGLPYVQVEATGGVGGNWAHGVYETAHIISSRRTTEYPDYPMPAGYPDFPSAAQMRAYYEDFARHFGLLDAIRFHTEVARVEMAGEAWRVQFADGRAEVFKGVVVCNGHHWARSLPPWAARFEGEVLHSKDYHRPAQLAGQRVLVVGGGNSGCDIACEAARVGASADWSLRRGYWFLPKTLLGVPSVELIKPWVPVPIQRAVIRGLLKVVVGPYERYGLPAPDHRIFEAHPTVSTEIFHYLKHGRITPRPDVQAVSGRTVTFVDGSAGTFDLLVCATGFDVAFPFLSADFVPIKAKVPELYGGMLRPDHRHLYIVGAYQPRYGIGPLLRPLALLLADWVRLQDELTVPLGRLLQAVGDHPAKTHLVDPHQALRRLKLARHLTPALRLVARTRGWLKPPTTAVEARA